MAASNITGLTNLATPQPTMLLYTGLSPFGVADDRKVTANALFAEITANISDLSVQFGDGAATATVSAAGKGKIRYNNATATFQFSANGAAYANFGTPGGSSGQLQWNNSSAFAGASGSAVTTLGEILLANTARGSGGSTRALAVRTPADTGLTASAESILLQFGGDASAATVTRQFATGALTTQRESVFVAPTYAFVGASTITSAATLAITGAPIAGANATITDSLAIWAQTGNIRIQTGNLTFGIVQSFFQLANTVTNISDALGVGEATAAIAWSVGEAGYAVGIRNTTDAAFANGFIVRTTRAASDSRIFTANIAGTDSVIFLGDQSSFFAGITSIGAYSASAAQLFITSGSASRIGLRVDSAASPSADIFDARQAGLSAFRVTFSGAVIHTAAARTSGVASYLQIVTPADATLTASTESIGIQLGGSTSAASVARQWATGALATQRGCVIVPERIAFVGASTVTDAATLAITGAPVAGTNATITNAISLWIQTGQVTFGDSVNLAVNATTGTKIATATSQRLGFWNTTPIIQPASANQAALTNSTGGTFNGTLVDVATIGVADPAKINDNFTDVFTLLDAIRTALVSSGLMKGAA